MKKALLILFLIPSIGFGQDVHVKAKMAFAQVKLDCKCEKCDCVDCKCENGKCECTNCVSKAKSAFDAVKIDCVCQNCDCINCTCTKEKCECKECNDFQAVYARAIKEQKVVVLAVGVPVIDKTVWTMIPVKQITGEKPGYIVGVPKDGQLIRMDFPPNTTRQRMRLDILHLYYPLTEGYVECQTCPQGRMFMGKR